MKNSKLTMLLLIACFALWGVVNNMSDNLVPAFQRIFTMDQSRAVLVQVAFYGAYAVLALFTSILVEDWNSCSLRTWTAAMRIPVIMTWAMA